MGMGLVQQVENPKIRDNDKIKKVQLHLKTVVYTLTT